MGQKVQQNTVMFTCPTYAFGMVLEPEQETSEWVKAFNFAVPEKFWYFPLSMQLEKYEAFFAWLEKKGYVKQSGEAPAVVPIVDWLHAQRIISSKSRMLPPTPRISDKIEMIQPFVWGVLMEVIN